jgi:hypothetical protein
MRNLLRELHFEFHDNELDSLIHLVAGAQEQRFRNDKARTGKVTRSTTIVVLAQLAPHILEILQDAGLDWKKFRKEIGLPLEKEIIPQKVNDVEVHRDLMVALSQFREKYPNRRKPTPATLATAIIQHMIENPSHGELHNRFEDSGTDFNLLPEEIPERRYAAWLCQYKPVDSETGWVKEAHPGATIRWRTGKQTLPPGMQVNDPVIYWRTVKNKADRGGLVGTGTVEAIELEQGDDGMGRFPTRVKEFFEDHPLPRDEVISFAQIHRRNWQGAVLKLHQKQALKIDELLRLKGHKPIFPDEPDGVGADDTSVRVRRDAPEKDHDSLGRAALAVSLAWTLHEVWCTEQGLAPYDARTPDMESPGFIAHLDSPWGGGKTTFANFVLRTLSAGCKNKIPDFLKKLYPNRKDVSGLFIPWAHEKRKLKNESGKYRWDREARRPWICVTFNAWLHQHVAPPWWCFYQEIRKACFRAVRREGLPTVHQSKNGDYYTEEDLWFDRHLRWIYLWGREILWRLTNGKVLFQLSVFLISFLAAFLILEFTGAEVDDKTVLPPTSEIGLVITFLTGAGSFITAAATIVADAFAPGRSLLGERVTLGSGDPLKRFRRHFGQMIQYVGRPVIVVIDDLDRCQPEFIVELTRGLQTILLSPRIAYLILGDRKWIEQAFEVQHENMNKIDVGPEHTFGGRFVQKAIQLSFSLPGIAEYQKRYVHEVLMGRKKNGEQKPVAADGLQAAEAQPSMPDVAQRLQLREKMAGADTAEAIDKTGRELEGQAGTDEQGRSDLFYQQTVREEVILRRAAQKEEVQEAIRHRLEDISEYLPSNPRHIKRIINAISMYQDSLLLTQGTLDEAGFGKKRWRQLVIGVILMMGFPKSWSILASNPELADHIVGKATAESEKLDTATQEQLKVLNEKEPVSGLLSKTQFYSYEGAKPERTVMDKTVIQWLTGILPVNRTPKKPAPAEPE